MSEKKKCPPRQGADTWSDENVMSVLTLRGDWQRVRTTVVVITVAVNLVFAVAVRTIATAALNAAGAPKDGIVRDANRTGDVRAENPSREVAQHKAAINIRRRH